ncbi:uncharacterized protein AAG666_014744 [Megaptera novaeangliae]
MRERNPRGRNRSRTLGALEIYPERCRKAPAQPETVLPPRSRPRRPAHRGPRDSPCARAADLGGATKRRLLSRPVRSALTRLPQARGLLLPGPRQLPARRLLPRGGRAGGAVTPAGTPRPPHLEAGSADLRAAPEAPRPPPAPCPGASAPRLGRFLPASGGGERRLAWGQRGSVIQAAEPASRVPQHSWVADSVRRDLAAPGTLATWRTSAPRLPAGLDKLRGRVPEPKAARS